MKANSQQPYNSDMEEELRERFYAGLAPAVAELVREAARLAAATGTPLHLVGGAVRDLLLGFAVLDVDLVMAGDAPALAGPLAAERGLKVSRAAAFNNAKVDVALGDGRIGHVDFVTARHEQYPQPGHLPKWWPGTLAQDLARRDFTINALAFSLYPAAPLLDPFNGRADLENGVIRVLHDRSFSDDPTRIFRAARFEQRFGFNIERHTLNLIRNALKKGLLDLLTADRVRHELERTLAEAKIVAQLRRLGELGVLAAIDPLLAWDERSDAEFERVGRAEARQLFAALLYRLPPEGRARVVKRLGLDRDTARLLEVMARLGEQYERLQARGLKASELDRLLSANRDAVALAARLWAGTAAGAALAGWLANPPTQPTLTGDDIRKLGLPPGPLFRDLKAALHAAVLDGEIAGREQETEFVRRWIAERQADHE